MKKILLGIFLSICTVSVVALSPNKASAAETQAMYRIYNPNSGEHFYTASAGERNSLVRIGWQDEGIGWVAPTTGEPVYRMYNGNAGDHHYTTNVAEKNNLERVGWKYEGIGWYSSTEKEVPLYRGYNPNAKAGSHNYTTNGAEHSNLLSVGWQDEGVAWYGVGGGSAGGNTEVVKIDIQTVKNDILTLTNKEREKKGLAPLVMDATIEKAADIRAEEIKDNYSHTRPDGTNWFGILKEVGYTGNFSSGENIHMRSIPATTEILGDYFVSGWVNSAGHYRAMTNPNYASIGIGVYVDEKGASYAVQIFSSQPLEVEKPTIPETTDTKKD